MCRNAHRTAGQPTGSADAIRIMQPLDDNIIDAGAMVSQGLSLDEAGAALEVLDTGRGVTLNVMIERRS